MEKLDITKMSLEEIKRRWAGIGYNNKKLGPILRKKIIELFNWYVHINYNTKFKKVGYKRYIEIPYTNVLRLITIYNCSHFNLFPGIYGKYDIDNIDAIELMKKHIEVNSLSLFNLTYDFLGTVNINGASFMDDDYEIKIYNHYGGKRKGTQKYLLSPYMIYFIIHNPTEAEILLN